MDKKTEAKKKRVWLTVESSPEVIKRIDDTVEMLNKKGGSFNRSDIIRLSIWDYLEKNNKEK